MSFLFVSIDEEQNAEQRRIRPFPYDQRKVTIPALQTRQLEATIRSVSPGIGMDSVATDVDTDLAENQYRISHVRVLS